MKPSKEGAKVGQRLFTTTHYLSDHKFINHFCDGFIILGRDSERAFDF